MTINFRYKLIYDPKYSRFNSYSIDIELVGSRFNEYMFYIPHGDKNLTKTNLNERQLIAVENKIDEMFAQKVSEDENSQIIALLDFHFPEDRFQRISYISKIKTLLGQLSIYKIKNKSNIHIINMWLKEKEQYMSSDANNSAESKNDKTRELMTVMEVMESIRASRQTLDNWNKKGILVRHRLGNKVFYHRKEVEDFMKKKQEE